MDEIIFNGLSILLIAFFLLILKLGIYDKSWNPLIVTGILVALLVLFF